MNTSDIRQQLQNYLEVADDKKIKALYTMMEGEIRESTISYSDELKSDLDKRYSSYKESTSKLVSSSQSKKRVDNILKRTPKK